MRKNSRPTQCDRIIEYLKAGNTITSLEAFNKLGIVRLGARICEIRKNGDVIIQSRNKKVKNRFGETCTVKEYFIGEM